MARATPAPFAVWRSIQAVRPRPTCEGRGAMRCRGRGTASPAVPGLVSASASEPAGRGIVWHCDLRYFACYLAIPFQGFGARAVRTAGEWGIWPFVGRPVERHYGP